MRIGDLNLSRGQIWSMCGCKVPMDAMQANAFIARRAREGCQESLRKYSCPVCGRYHVTKATLLQEEV